jgi:hypothetical protein
VTPPPRHTRSRIARGPISCGCCLPSKSRDDSPSTPDIHNSIIPANRGIVKLAQRAQPPRR